MHAIRRYSSWTWRWLERNELDIEIQEALSKRADLDEQKSKSDQRSGTNGITLRVQKPVNLKWTKMPKGGRARSAAFDFAVRWMHKFAMNADSMPSIGVWNLPSCLTKDAVFRMYQALIHSKDGGNEGGNEGEEKALPSQIHIPLQHVERTIPGCRHPKAKPIHEMLHLRAHKGGTEQATGWNSNKTEVGTH